LNIDIDGVKHPASLGEGLHQERHPSYQAAGRVRERGLDVSRPILTVLDGSKALRRAVLDVFVHPVVAQMPATQPAIQTEKLRSPGHPPRLAHAEQGQEHELDEA
jgi:hypothetical protein